MPVDWDRLDLQQIELARLHESAKTLIENVRAVCFATQSGKPSCYKTGMQASQSADCLSDEVINGSRRDCDLLRHSTIHRFLRCASSRHFHIVISARLEVCLETPRNIGYARLGVRTLQQIHYLSAHGLRTVNGSSAKRDATEEILPPLVNRNDNVHLVVLPLELVTRRIDYDIQKTVRDVKTLYEMRSFLHIGSDKRQSLFQPRVALTGRPHHVLEQFVCRLMRVSMENDRAQYKSGAFGNVQTHAPRRFDDVMHVYFRVAVFSIKNFKEKGEVVCPSGA